MNAIHRTVPIAHPGTIATIVTCLLLASMAGGCARPGGARQPAGPRALASAGSFPALGPAAAIEPGVRFHEVLLPRAGGTTRLWIYLPAKAPRGKLPCVMIAPAGSSMFHGMALGGGDRPEHLPYARAGFAVVAYELDGHLDRNAGDRAAIAAARAFQAADAGLVNAREALAYALAKVPGIDPRRVFTAGHSSAATTSLLVAEHVPGIRGCVAYAPITDVPAHLGQEAIGPLSRHVPGFREFITRRSPHAGLARLRCPVFLFRADDDSVVLASQIAPFVQKLRKSNPRVTFARVPTGEHYDSMIRQGIPMAIRWMERLSE